MNRRELKKKINSIVENFADDCLELEQNQPKKSAEINAMIDDAAELLDDTMHEIAKTSQFNGKEVKAHYARIAKEFDDRLETLEATLGAIKK